MSGSVVVREIHNGVAPNGYSYLHHDGYAFGFHLKASSVECEDVYQWCVDQFGPGPSGERWYQARYIVWFSNQADATAFKLRWM